MIFDENTPYLGNDFDGDTVVLVACVGGRKDRHFSRNYAYAKHAANRGKLKTIIVKVKANGENYRTVDAFRRAVGKPHPATRVCIDGKPEHAMAIVDQITAIVPSAKPECGGECPLKQAKKRKGFAPKPRKQEPKVEVPEEPVGEPTIAFSVADLFAAEEAEEAQEK